MSIVTRASVLFGEDTCLTIPEVAMRGSDAQGVYRVADPRSWANIIIVKHADFAPAWHPPATLDFTLDAGKEIHGSVVDANSRPVSGASVSVDEMTFATTDANGKFDLPHVSRDAMMLSARASSGVVMTRVTSGTPTLKLQAAAHVSGAVRDAEKRTLSGINVVIGNQTFTDMDVTDANGTFSIDVPRGKYTLV
ncbi:MAG TPA: carboxypeptidase regulatory-like domain-containing protein, partial [Thermoanaerobaculia bacterium]